MGGAAQSHPEVQAAAVQAGHRIKLVSENIRIQIEISPGFKAERIFSLSTGVLPLLLRLIHLDGDARVAARAFYALSSLLR